MKPGDLARASQHELDYQGRTSLFWSKAFRLNEDVDGGNRFVTSVGIVSIRQIKLYWRKNPGSKAKDKVVEEFIIHNTNRHLEEDIEDYRMFFMSILVGGMRGGSAVEFICSRPERSLEAGRFELDLDDFRNKLSNKTKIVSLVHVSNTLGCCNPIEEISDLAHQKGSLVLLDACQSLAHKPVDIKKLGIDFLAGSSHKLCGPTGIGFLWGREEILKKFLLFLVEEK